MGTLTMIVGWCYHGLLQSCAPFRIASGAEGGGWPGEQVAAAAAAQSLTWGVSGLALGLAAAVLILRR